MREPTPPDDRVSPEDADASDERRPDPSPWPDSSPAPDLGAGPAPGPEDDESGSAGPRPGNGAGPGNESEPGNGSEPGNATASAVVVIVIRTGGIAGIPRRWRAMPAPDEEERWISLVERCPWDAPDRDEPGADRFRWRIEARTPAGRRERELPETQLDGPWRTLVDAVRQADPA
ncbi:protealysin inhibitor emfourin [Microbacterium resistens]|uniref:protealysin inhibitor emfourin n=1 Tax=Microbacterium resistens TaxID=156977 RepID=UPI001E4404D9|nr:protealysin inhibitor emfourin [Microbacterium resistens]